MQLKSRSSIILILGVFWGIIGLSMITGAWQAKTTTEQVAVNSPSDIKGWMTLSNVSEYFKVPVPDLIKVFGFPSDVESDKPLKDIAGDIGKEVDDLRGLLAAHLGIESETADPSGGEAAVSTKSGPDVSAEPGAPDAAPSNKSEEKPAEKQVQPLEPKNNDTSVPVQTEQPKETPRNPEGSSGDSETIKGRMTLKEVEYLTKVPVTYICEQLGIPDSVDKNAVLRDLAQQYGFEVDKIREIAAEYKP